MNIIQAVWMGAIRDGLAVWQVGGRANDGTNERHSNLTYNTVATNITRSLSGENINQRNKNNESDNNYCIGCVCMYGRARELLLHNEKAH